jgi:hypothetical protein
VARLRFAGISSSLSFVLFIAILEFSFIGTASIKIPKGVDNADRLGGTYNNKYCIAIKLIGGFGLWLNSS